MKFFIIICIHIFFNKTYALYGQPCRNNSGCTGAFEICMNGRCSCKDRTVSQWDYYMEHACKVRVPNNYHFYPWRIPRCRSDRCVKMGLKIPVCNENRICVCPPEEIEVMGACYKVDKPNPKSFLKDCSPGRAFFKYTGEADDYWEFKKNDSRKVPFCHPEDNVYCSGVFKCLCYPEFYGDNMTKLCRPKSEFLQAYNLTEYKVKPGMYCLNDDDCIEGLDCKQNFCHCPDGCVYKETLDSCDCGSYYASQEYSNMSFHDFFWPPLIGLILAIFIIGCWCRIIEITFACYPDLDDATGNTEEALALNTQPSEVNQVVNVPLVEPSGNTINPPSGTPPLTPYSTPLPYSLDARKMAAQSKENVSDSHTNQMAYGPQPYDPQPSAPQAYGMQTSAPQPSAPQPYGVQPSAPQLSAPQPSAPQPFGPQPFGVQSFSENSPNPVYPEPYSEPPPSYAESVKEDAPQIHPSK